MEREDKKRNSKGRSICTEAPQVHLLSEKVSGRLM